MTSRTRRSMARATEHGYLMGLLDGYWRLLEAEADAQDEGVDEQTS